MHSLLIATMLALSADDSLAEKFKSAGPHEVETVLEDWKDATRDRIVPVKIYLPKAKGPFPVIIFSHGLGGSRTGYEYLGKHWASHGYVSVHLQHIGSDTAVWMNVPQPMEAMKKAAADPKNSINRPLDVKFAIDQLTRKNSDDSPVKGKLDLNRLGMSGHSFGGYTTLAVAGQTFVGPAGRGITVGDVRVIAAIPMSAPVPKNKDKDNLDKSFATVNIPCLNMTGTLDDSPIGDTKATERRLIFDHTPGPDQYFINFQDGDHMIFSGRAGKQSPAAKKDPQFQDLIKMTTTAFWDSYLRGNAPAKTWLRDGACKTTLGTNAMFEHK